MEVNTRVQVEHTVTEELTGIDLVREQIAIAQGKALSFKQSDIKPVGHVIQFRINAEDPTTQFSPSPGKLQYYASPGGPHVRVDSACYAGYFIPPYYDSMIAKLIVFGEDRTAAIERLQQALEHCVVFGVTTNIPLLHTISKHPAFRQGDTYTDFLENHALPAPEALQSLSYEIVQAATLYEIQGQNLARQADSNPWQSLGPWRMAGEERLFSYRYQEQSYRISVRASSHAPAIWHSLISTTIQN